MTLCFQKFKRGTIMRLPPISRPSLYNWSRTGARPMRFVANKEPKAWDLEQEEQDGEASQGQKRIQETER